MIRLRRDHRRMLAGVAGFLTLVLSSAAAAATPTSAPKGHEPAWAEHGRFADRLYAVDNHVPPGSSSTTPALIDVIDPVTDAIEHTIQVGPQPHHIYVVPNSRKAYVTHFVGNALDVIDLRTNRVVGHVTVGSGPRHLVFSPDGRYAYVVGYTDAEVTVVRTSTDTDVASIPTGAKPNYPRVSDDNQLVYTVAEDANSVTVAQARPPFRVLGTIPVGADPFDLAFADRGHTLVVANAGDNTVSLIDVRTRRVTDTISIRPTPAAGEAGQKLNVRVDGRCAWVGDQQGAAFAVIDLHTRTLATRIPAASGADIYKPITIGPARGLAITTARYGPYLDVVDPRHPRLIETVTTAPSPPGRSTASYQGDTGPAVTGSHLLVTNTTGTRAYVSDRPGGTVSVLNLAGGHPRLLKNIALSYGSYSFPDGLAYVHFVQGKAVGTGG